MRKIVVTVAFASLASAGIMLAPQATSAASLPNGQYNVAGLQQICILNGNPKTWYGTTFPNWGGRWAKKKKQILIYGNYAAGTGNDTIVFPLKGGNPYSIVWIEWNNSFSHSLILVNRAFSFVKAICDPPADVRLKKGDHPGS
jgi:hypothetical protein